MVDGPTSQMVIGSDDEKALAKAISVAIPDFDQGLRARHFEQNAVNHLREKVGVSSKTRHRLVEEAFGGGWTYC